MPNGRSGITGMDDVENEMLEHLWALKRWTCAWYDEAIKVGAIGASYSLDTATIDRLRGYFISGLSPAEAVLACFSRRH